VAQTDIANTQAESKETNNTASAHLALTLPPLPDLAIAQITSPGSGLPGQTLTLTWAVTNRGTAVASGLWAESVSITNPAAPRWPLATFSFSNNLAPATSVTRTQQVTLPANFAAGASRFLVEADSEQAITESI